MVYYDLKRIKAYKKDKQSIHNLKKGKIYSIILNSCVNKIRRKKGVCYLFRRIKLNTIQKKWQNF